MSFVAAVLEPIHRQNEVLLNGIVRRPSLQLTAGVPLVLGRNHTTGIALTSISRSAATLSYKEGEVWISQGGTTRPLKNGEIISLQKPSEDYAYRLQIGETATATSTTTDTTCPLKDASEEAMCAVCMEIMVEATTIVPCGHLFCKTCLSSLPECPNCRLVVKQTMPLKGMDNLIHKLVLSGKVFCPPDMQQYWKRIQSEAPPVRFFFKKVDNGFLYSTDFLWCFAIRLLTHGSFLLFRSHLLCSHLPPKSERETRALQLLRQHLT
jgi:hypothetical protein